MLRSTSDIEHEATVDTDVCIIGGGPAALSAATRLDGSPLRVLIIESGGDRRSPLSLVVDPRSRWSELNTGTSSGLNYFLLNKSRMRRLGGTPYIGTPLQSGRFDSIDMQARPWVPDSGWPIPLDELSPYYSEIEEESALGTEPYDGSVVEAAHPGYYPFDRHIMTPMILRFMQRSLLDRHIQTVKRSENISVCLNATCTALSPKADGSGVSTIHVATPGKKTFRVRAKRFVLASGTVQNCRLLLESGEDRAALGNQNDLVGRYFMEHPNLFAARMRWTKRRSAKYFRTPAFLKRRILKPNFVLTEDYQREHKLLNFSCFFSKPVAFTHISRVMMHQFFRPDVHDRVVIRFEMAPYANNRITLGIEKDRLGLRTPNVHMEMGDLERRTLRAFASVLESQVRDSKIGEVVDLWPTIDRVLEHPTHEGLGYQWHHLGGTRMSTDARQGVVDANGKVHSTSNLFIAGSGVFPTGGHINPTLTLMALSRRLGDHLKTTPLSE